MAIKTRDKLIDVARQLFARKGVENTTINDIAEASDKGRRTFYTYFKNKLEIYKAVIETQSNIVTQGVIDIFNRQECSYPQRLSDALYFYFKALLTQGLKTSKRRIILVPNRTKLIEESMSKTDIMFTSFLQRGGKDGAFRSDKIKSFATVVRHLSYYYYGYANVNNDKCTHEYDDIKSTVNFLVSSITIN